MRSFDEVAVERELYLWGNSRLGLLYLPRSKDLGNQLFRHFGGDGERELVRPFAELVEACRVWVAARPEVAAMVAIQPVLEVGQDFVCRNYEQAYVKLRTYHEQLEPDWEDEVLEPPPELEVMRALMTRALAGEASGRERVVREVLRASLLRGSGKTVEENDGTWLVLEPSIGPDDVRAWMAAAPAPGLSTPGVSGSVIEQSDRGILDTLPIYQRQGTGEYFETELADRWPLNWWGLPGFARKHLQLAKPDVPFEYFQTESGSPALRAEVSAYLDAGVMALVGQVPEESCKFCDQMIHIASYQSDDVWLWPSDLGHRVTEHGFYVPNRMIDHIRATGQPPSSLQTPVEQLPWPQKENG